MTIRDLLAAAKHVGEWRVGHKRPEPVPYIETTQLGNDGVIYGAGCWTPDEDDYDSTNAADIAESNAQARLICAAVNGAEALLEEVEKLRAHDLRLRGLLYAANYWVNSYMRKGVTHLVDAVRAIEHRDDVDYACALQTRVDQQSDRIGLLEANVKDITAAKDTALRDLEAVRVERDGLRAHAERLQARVNDLSAKGGI